MGPSEILIVMSLDLPPWVRTSARPWGSWSGVPWDSAGSQWGGQGGRSPEAENTLHRHTPVGSRVEKAVTVWKYVGSAVGDCTGFHDFVRHPRQSGISHNDLPL
jgi:hypothetical protein